MAERQTSFPRLLRRFRLVAGLSQEELAERAGLSTRGVSDLERGLHASPRPETVRMLAEALGLGQADRGALVAAAYPELAAAGPSASAPAAPPPGAPSGRQSAALGPAPLPIPPTRLVGREAEVARLCALLRRAEVRLLTLTGPGGVGKTRLALAAADELTGEGCYAEGAAFVDLSPVRDPDDVAMTVAAALGVQETGGEPLEATLKSTLRQRRFLLVLDTFEHLFPAALFVADLLATCPDLITLVTSRERLRLRGEHEIPVAPLALPAAPDPHRLAPLQGLAGVAAVRLFAERAEEANPDFALTAEDAEAVAEICRRLDGLPLAIELAAAQVRLLPPRDLLARLERRLPVLTGGARDLPARQRTLRDAIAWSHDLLGTAERIVLRRLAVFVGGFTLDAAGGVCRGIQVSREETALHLDCSPPAILEAIGALVDGSLVQREPGAVGQPRFRMLETIREFALERLAESGEEEAARRAQAAVFADVAERLLLNAWQGEESIREHLFSAEYANLRAALDWALTEGSPVDALRLAAAVGRFALFTGQLRDGRALLDAALQRGADAPTEVRAGVLFASGALSLYVGDYAEADRRLREALALQRQSGDWSGFARTLNHLGAIAEYQGDDATAVAHYEEALAVARATNNRRAIGSALADLADAAYRQNDLVTALAQGEEAMRVLLELESHVPAVIAMTGVAQVACALGDLVRTSVLLRDAAELAMRIGHALNLADTVAGFAAYASAYGQFDQAARLLGAVAAAQERLSCPVLPHHAQQRRTAEAVRAALGERAFAAAVADGRALSLNEAAAEAMALVDDTARPSVSAVGHGEQPLGPYAPVLPEQGHVGDDSAASTSGAS